MCVDGVDVQRPHPPNMSTVHPRKLFSDVDFDGRNQERVSLLFSDTYSITPDIGLQHIIILVHNDGTRKVLQSFRMSPSRPHPSF